MKKHLFTLLILMFCGSNFAQVNLLSFISDNMVLQQEFEAPIWGWAETGIQITITPSWDNTVYQSSADYNGDWFVKIATPSAGPYSLIINEDTLFQLLAEEKRNPNLLSVADKMLLIPDFLNFMLSGNKKSEFTIASTTSLADPHNRNWSWELIEKFGLPKNIFPEMVEPGTVLGTLLPLVAEQTGLNSNIPVFASAGHDTASAVVSVPAEGNEWAFLSSGTWSLMGVEIEKPLLGPNSMKYNFTNEGGVEGTTRFLKNIIGLWPIQECRRYWLEKGKEYSYPELAGLAKAEGFVNAWVDLDDARFLKDGEMPEKIISYLEETGQAVKNNVGFIIAVVLESLTFSYRKTVKEIEEATHKKIDKLHAVGGGIQNELLSQYTADAIGRAVIAGPVEGTIIGNIGVQAMASGEVKDLKSWRNIVQSSFDVKKYEPIHSEYFNENDENYKSILRNKDNVLI